MNADSIVDDFYSNVFARYVDIIPFLFRYDKYKRFHFFMELHIWSIPELRQRFNLNKTLNIRAWMRYSIPNFNMDTNIYPCRNLDSG